MIWRVRGESDRLEVCRGIMGLGLDREWLVRVGISRDVRSVSQNRLYWLWLGCLSDELGDSRVVYHDYFKMRLGVLGSTSGLDTLRFGVYLDRIHQISITEFGIHLPCPGGDDWFVFEDKYKDFIV